MNQRATSSNSSQNFWRKDIGFTDLQVMVEENLSILCLKHFLQLEGIRFMPTHAYAPEENALVENLNGVFVNKMRAAMYA